MLTPVESLGQIYGINKDDNKGGTFTLQDYLSLLSTSYRSDTPVETLHTIIMDNSITMNDLYWTVENIHYIKCSPNSNNVRDKQMVSPMCDTLNDLETLNALLSSNDDITSIQLKCQFMYFATCLIHLWGESNDNKKFYLDISKPIICYVRHNEPCSYICFNIKERTGELVLEKHTMYSEDFGAEKPFRVMVHRTHAPGKMDKLRFSFDLTTRRSMQTARNTNGMMHISVRLDERVNTDTFGARSNVTIGARHWGNFCIFLTFGEKKELVYIGYNKEIPEKDKVIIHPCIAALHEI
jgi:hypothetical protein